MSFMKKRVRCVMNVINSFIASVMRVMRVLSVMNIIEIFFPSVMIISVNVFESIVNATASFIVCVMRKGTNVVSVMMSGE